MWLSLFTIHQTVTTLLFAMLSVMCSYAQSCPTLCNPMDCSPPGSSLCGIFQVRIVEWVAIAFSRGSSQPRTEPECLASSALAVGFFTTRATWKGPINQLYPNTNKVVVCFFFKKETLLGFPGGSVVKNPPPSAGDTDSIPGPGSAHMPWSKEAPGPQLLKPLRPGGRAPTREQLPQRETRTPQPVSSPCSLQLEKARAERQRPGIARDKQIHKTKTQKKKKERKKSACLQVKSRLPVFRHC